MLALASPVLAQDPSEVNCGDFTSQPEAQEFFEANDPANDPYLLDEDDGPDDGVACEDLPPGEPTPPAEPDEPTDDQYDPTTPTEEQYPGIQPNTPESCEGIQYQEDFERCAAQYDPETGLPLEGDTGTTTSTTEEPTETTGTGTEGVGAGLDSGDLPETGGFSLLLPALLMLVGVGVVARKL